MNKPRKRFGQHFLVDQQVIGNIVAAIHPQPTDQMVEIGPGRGALTLPLLKHLDNLAVVEFDRDLIPVLEKISPKLCIHAADALTFDFNQCRKDAGKLLRVVGNLPYNISTPLIFHLLGFAPIIRDMVFMLQKEVAERLAAAVNSNAYGRLSIMSQYFCTAEILFEVGADAFNPPPKVESSIIQLIPHQNLPFKAINFANFDLIVKTAFNQRRKTLSNSLKALVPNDVWNKVNIDPKLRPECLSIAEFVQLSNILEAKI